MALHNISGKAAEGKVVKHLKKQGYKIIDQNWKTKWCEVDIVAKKDECMHFVEVKFRGSDIQGSGFDYITPQKLRKMELAARSWVEINNWEGEYTLSAAQVSGNNYNIDFIDAI
jgi:Holliday junction resolvase-like predicted endonuclease